MAEQICGDLQRKKQRTKTLEASRIWNMLLKVYLFEKFLCNLDQESTS